MSDDVEDQPKPELPTISVDPERMGEHRVLIELGTAHRRFSATVDHLKQTVTSVLIGEFGMAQEEAKAHAAERVEQQLGMQNISGYIDQLKAEIATLTQERDNDRAGIAVLERGLKDAHEANDRLTAEIAALKAGAEQNRPDSGEQENG